MEVYQGLNKQKTTKKRKSKLLSLLLIFKNAYIHSCQFLFLSRRYLCAKSALVVIAKLTQSSQELSEVANLPTLKSLSASATDVRGPPLYPFFEAIGVLLLCFDELASFFLYFIWLMWGKEHIIRP